MAPRSSAAAMRSIRRELHRRRPRPLAPARPPPTKKTSATPPSTKKTSATLPSRPARHPGRDASLRPRQDPPSRYASLSSTRPPLSSSPLSRSCPPLLPSSHVSAPLKTPPRASSAATTRSIRLEKPWPLAPTKPPAAKKISATPPAAKKTSATPPAAKKTTATPPAAKKTSATPPAAKKTSATPPAAKKTSATPPSRTERDPGRETSLRQPSRPAACPVASACAGETLRPGTAVLARTRTATLRTGQVLVLWLKAVVVSATEGGYEIVYEGGWPRDDPCATVQVARDHVRLRTPTPSTTPPPPQLPSSTARSRSSTATSVATAPKKKMKPTPRPTTAGESVRVVRKLFPELFDDSDATALEKDRKAAPRPTRAGKSIRLVRKLWPETERPPKPMLP